MKVLVIGGTGFIGPHLVRRLAEMGHSVTVFHRGVTHPELPAEELCGSRQDLLRLRPEADVVVDLILGSGSQAQSVMEAFHGRAGRIVAASSIDVYRACGILHGTEDGPPEPVPLTEESPLRTRSQTYPPAQLEALRHIFHWVDDDYDKIPVERAILGTPELPGTIVRLPMIYGPGDRLHRLYPMLKRIDDRRPILLERRWSSWRSPRGYVENVAAALALAVTSPQAAGRVYNYAEAPAFTELEWARQIAQAAGTPLTVVELPDGQMPAHLAQPGNSAQHWDVDSYRIRRELGYREPVPLDEALRRTVAWQREHPPVDLPLHRFDYAAEEAAIARARH